MSTSTTPSSLRERENIAQDSQQTAFPEPIALQPEFASPVFRRARAGTVPSRFSPVTLTNNSPPPSALPTTTRPSPAPSPFKANAPSSIDIPDTTPISVPATTPSVVSRLRSGSLNLPPRNPYVSPLFNSVFPNTWTTRERNVSTSSNVPSSPAHSSFSREDDASMRTLDYLGLADTPQPAHATLAKPPSIDPVVDGQRAAALQPFIGDMSGLHRNLNRFRSYSVNAKEKYAEDEEEEEELQYGNHSGQITPSSAAPNVLMHSAVAAYKGITASRPRSRTTGILESPPVRTLKSYVTTPSRLDAITNASELQRDYFDMTNAVDQLQLGNSHVRPSSGEGGMMNIIEETHSHVEGPTRSLWLGNIPASTTITSLNAIFQVYGTVESARVLTHKNCGFVNFERIESAIQSRNLLNGKEIFPGAGPVRIGFAKVQGPPGSNGAPTPNGVFNSASPDPYNNSANNGVGADGGSASGRDNTQPDSRPHVNALAAALEVPELRDLKDDIINIVREFGADLEEQKKIEKNIISAVEYNSFKDEIPAIPEPSHNRVHDAPKLREIRKRIDNNNCSTSEIEDIALGMLDEIAELSSDYLGNTVVQKLFEFCSEDVKEAMLDRIAPHLAEIGIHKNGTWAGQKIIDVAKTSSQMSKIMHHLRPYCVALFMDQYGNYVLQCCLRFGSPYNDFIFETMLSRMWEIAQGRFGARAMRACLESHHASKDQQRMLAAAIALHSVQLASNANGALLLTWFLDTCNFPRRRTVLAPRLVPHLVHLCTHKVAYLTVLKVINQRNEPEARDTILRALFFSPNDKVLEEILSDHACGATLIFKVLTTPFFDETLRTEVVQNVQKVLIRLKAQPAQGYKRLMEEVGLPTRNGGSNNSNSSSHSRDNAVNGNSSGHERTHRNNAAQNNSSGSTQNNQNHQNHQVQNHNREFQNPYYAGAPPAQFDPTALAATAASLPRPPPMDTAAAAFMEQLALNNALYNPAQAGAMTVPQLQYQAAMMQQAAMRPGLYPPMPTYGAPAAPQDQFRGVAQHTPTPAMLPPQTMFGIPPAFNPLMAQQLMGAYPYPPMNGVPLFPPQQQQPQQPQQPQQQGGGSRRGRVDPPSEYVYIPNMQADEFI
ncbi:hypothetical protein BDZ91DRAFT_667989 [Kalaharituber pfeilii]|nr:hypothetical protein BDZ91DRAFT_667989 [Kalaharituber pfeilii]